MSHGIIFSEGNTVSNSFFKNDRQFSKIVARRKTFDLAVSLPGNRRYRINLFTHPIIRFFTKQFTRTTGNNKQDPATRFLVSFFVV